MIKLKPEIEVLTDKFIWTQKLPGNAGDLYYFEFYRDEQGLWVSQMNVDEDYRRKGYAEEIIKIAMKKYGIILFSNLPHAKTQEDYDKRYLLGYGKVFVEGLIKKGIITKDSYCTPLHINNNC